MAKKKEVPSRNNVGYVQPYMASSLYAASSIFSFTPSSEPPSLPLLFSVLFGLPIALWTYKCLVMILFQKKIIYMGYIPPGTRQEKLVDVPNLSALRKDHYLEQTRITSSDKVTLSALIMSKKNVQNPDCVVVYLQGNAGNPLHRIPVFTSLLSCAQINPVILAPSPRSYWSSTNRTPTEAGLITDYTAALQFAARKWPRTPLVLYGHSLGGAIAICLLASLDTTSYPRGQEKLPETKNALRGLVLENPFSSIPDMVRALYPQRWLPYRHLAPLAWDKWDALRTMRDAASSFSSNSSSSNSSAIHETSYSMESSETTKLLPRLAQNMLVLISSRDEVVPPTLGRAIFDARPSQGSMSGADRSRLVEIDGALHEDAWRQRQWRKEMGLYLEDITQPRR